MLLLLHLLCSEVILCTDFEAFLGGWGPVLFVSGKKKTGHRARMDSRGLK